MDFAPACAPNLLAWTMSGDGEGRGWARFRRMSSPEAALPDERSLEDARLIRRMAGGEHEAMAELYERFSRPLYSTSLHILKDAAEAQDIVHDVFIALWEKAAVFAADRGSAFSWAVTLTRNRSIDRLRSRRRRAELLDQAAPADLGYFETITGSDGNDPAALQDQAQAVRAAVAALPREQKHALELAFFSGLTQQEIAVRLSEPLGTVKARIRRGLVKLRESLAPRL